MEEAVVASEHCFSAGLNVSSEMQGVIGGQMLVPGEVRCLLPDRLGRPLSFAADSGEPKQFRASFKNWTQAGFVVMHE